jgi:N-acetylglucosamine-6-phosphate deacetylase
MAHAMNDLTRRSVLARGVALAASLASPAGSPAEPPASAAAATQSPRRLGLPGLFDLQANGFAGVDFGDPAVRDDQLLAAAEAIARTGVTRFLPTLITSPFETFAACARRLSRLRSAAVAGLHMEGPYISPEDGYRGAHARAFVRDADVDDFRRRQDAADGRIRLLTLAPEVPGALRLVEHAVAAGVRVAIGHTNATGAQIGDAVSAGATLSTHLGNGCASIMPRHPNVIWEQLGEDRLLASFIVDGHHLPPATVRSVVRAKTPERTILVTDATAAAGMPPGRYTIGGQLVELDATGRVAAPGASNLAGSALTLDRAIANTVRITGLPLETVAEMASTRPASYLGLAPSGRVEVEWDEATGTLRVLGVRS